MRSVVSRKVYDIVGLWYNYLEGHKVGDMSTNHNYLQGQQEGWLN